MAMKLNAGEVTRSEVFGIFPENIVVDPLQNGRAAPVSQEVIDALAASILEYGQQQPVLVRRIDDKKVQLVAGYGRHRAILHINSTQPDNPIKLRCVCLDMNGEEAFLHNLVENRDRCETTPVDDAHNQRRLREHYGWSEARIAEFYGKSVGYIYQLRKIVGLSEPLQESVSEGNLSITAALDLSELPEDARNEIVQEATHPKTGRVSTAAIRKAVRGHKATDGSEGHKARSMKELRTFLDEQTGPAEKDSLRGISRKFLDFISGKATETQMRNAMEKFCKD